MFGMFVLWVDQPDPSPSGFEEIVEDPLVSTDWIQAGIVVAVTLLVAFIANRIRALDRRAHRRAGLCLARDRSNDRLRSRGDRADLCPQRARGADRPAPGCTGYQRSGARARLAGRGRELLRVADPAIAAAVHHRRHGRARRAHRCREGHRLADRGDSRSLDGTWIRVPNSKVLTDPIVTLTTESFRRSRLTVGVAYDTNLAVAADVIAEALQRVARICDDPPPLVVVGEFGELEHRSLRVLLARQRHTGPARCHARRDAGDPSGVRRPRDHLHVSADGRVAWRRRRRRTVRRVGRRAAGRVYTEHPAVPGGRGTRSPPSTSRGWVPWRRS